MTFGRATGVVRRAEWLLAVSGMGADVWTTPINDVLTSLETTAAGLSSAQAAARRPPTVAARRGMPSWWPLLVRQFTSPMVLVLAVATGISMALGNVVDGVIILVMILASGLLGFVQERRAGALMTRLLARVRVHADVLRDGRAVEVLPQDLVRGDVVLLQTGDIVPADLRLIESTTLLIDESSITGEPNPAEKQADRLDGSVGLSPSAVYYGSHVVGGRGTGVVVEVGAETKFGSLIEHLERKDIETRFEHEMTAFGLMLTRVIMLLVIAVLLINVLLHRPLIDSMLFALALGVGITPEMLPAIVMVSLSIGARLMARKSVLVKRLDAIEDIGAMTVLCCDKTGTLTRGVVEVDRALDPEGVESERVLRLAAVNAALQQDYPNPLDRAITHRYGDIGQVHLMGEVPYDFERRRLSVLTSDGEFICKGAFESVLGICTQVRIAGECLPIATVLPSLHAQFEQLSSAGFRVLGVASRGRGIGPVGVADERELVFEGVLALQDPVTDNARAAIDHLREINVELALITGDNASIATSIARTAGLPVDRVLTGVDLDVLDDQALAEAARVVRVFASVDPVQKERIVLALKRLDHTVGFLGDGINDTAALRVADVGIAVDTGADVAKQAAALVILDKNLDVIADGIRLGRRTFANTLKYVRVTISANFGNMLSLVLASVVLPFIPLLPAQILLLNLLSDGPALAIATDRVDPEQEASPRTWNMRSIRGFMVVFGLVSSVFDITAFVVLRLVLHADPELFRSSWFVLSLFTELIALLVLRSNRSLFRSRPSRMLVLASGLMVAIGLLVGLTTVGALFAMAPLPAKEFVLVVGLSLGYVVANELVKAIRRRVSAAGVSAAD